MTKEELKINDALFTQLIFSKINGEPTTDLNNILFKLVERVSSEKRYQFINSADKIVYEMYAYNFCRKHFDKYNLDKRPQPIVYFKMLIRSSFSTKIMEYKHNLKPYTTICKICHKPFGDNLSLYEHINEYHNR